MPAPLGGGGSASAFVNAWGLGDARINVEDLTLHHVSRSVGGDLVLFVAGQAVADTAGSLLDDLGYPTVVTFSGDSGD